MLELREITKVYPAGGEDVEALKGIDLKFRNSEFVSILGPSGCGKTTLLNIIGGLDQYTSGDLIINGKSTKEYNDRDWDTYRNHSVGFVFQSYNLIPHQSVLPMSSFHSHCPEFPKMNAANVQRKLWRRLALQARCAKDPLSYPAVRCKELPLPVQ